MTNTGVFKRGSFLRVSYLIVLIQRTGSQGNNSAPMSGTLVKVLCSTSPARDSLSASSLTTQAVRNEQARLSGIGVPAVVRNFSGGHVIDRSTLVAIG